ncbi:MAG: 4-(cytidine 5'-diphospho)-2-C-methyl-D-erythritol kinase [Candidatus Puniceispirillaceae bacterium]
MPHLSATQIAPAKINLTLQVTGRDEAGYHHLESVTCFAAFGDHLTITPSDKELIIDTKGPFASALEAAGGDNLVARAIALASQIHDTAPFYHVTIDKQIPLGGGLGGGSADAAAMLRYLSDDWPEQARRQLRENALRLGADVPACFDSHIQIMSKKGEEANWLTLSENRPYLLIANPGCHADTAAVFAAFAKSGAPFSHPQSDRLTQLVATGAWRDLCAIGNDLTKTATGLYPAIGDLLDEITAIGAHCQDDFLGANMSGSGASCYALFTDESSASFMHTKLLQKGIWAKISHFF